MPREPIGPKPAMFVVADERSGGSVLAVALSALLTLIQLLTVSSVSRLSIALFIFILTAVLSTVLLIVIQRSVLIAPVLLPSTIIEFTLMLSAYGNHFTTVLGLLHEMAMAGQRGLLETYLSWFVPTLLLAVLTAAAGPRRSKLWWILVAVVLLVLSFPLKWPPGGLFI